MFLSVIVRTKDRALLLKRNLLCLDKQSNKDFEVIIINNGGNSLEVESVCIEFSKSLQIKIVHLNEPHKMEYASNVGVRNAKGDLIVLLDDDDTWESNFVECIYEKYCDNKDADLFVCKAKLVYEEVVSDSTINIVKCEPMDTKEVDVSLEGLVVRNRFTTNSFVVRKNLYAKIGCYCEELEVLGDWEFNLRAFIFSNKVIFIEDVLSNYHKRIGNYYANTAVEKHLRSDWVVRKKIIPILIRNNNYKFALLMFFVGVRNKASLVKLKLLKR